MEQEVDSFVTGADLVLDTYAPATKLANTGNGLLSKYPRIQCDEDGLIQYEASLAANYTANRAAKAAKAAACLLDESGGVEPVEAPSGKQTVLAANSDRLASRGMATDDVGEGGQFTLLPLRM